MIETWVLTFNRPVALNRLIRELGRQEMKVNIFSNHPKVHIDPDNHKHVGHKIINTLNSPESNSWCARSWNTIFMKAFDGGAAEIICLQDDTFVGPNFADWIHRESHNYEVIWGPAGDQFFYITMNAFTEIGWWDERYIGCYCGDAEYIKRAYIALGEKLVSVEDTHNWGFRLNPCGVMDNIITTYESKTIDTNYDNQHWEFERICGCGEKTTETNPVILHSQKHFENKWGVKLDNGLPVISNLERKMEEIDWYPWFTNKHGILI